MTTPPPVHFLPPAPHSPPCPDLHEGDSTSGEPVRVTCERCKPDAARHAAREGKRMPVGVRVVNVRG